ncbi:MAG: ribonuclease P protein component [Rhodospirillales bacterium]
MPSAFVNLKRRSEFIQAAKSGRKWVAPGLIVQTRTHDCGEDIPESHDIRVGFTVSRKVGNAVKRNRVKRRLRAAVKQVFPVYARKGCDYVVIGRAATLRRPFGDLVGDLETALKRLDAYCKQ